MRRRSTVRVTPDGRYFVVRGRLWRMANPNLDESTRKRLVAELMAARLPLRPRSAPAIAMRKTPHTQTSIERRSLSANAAPSGGRTARPITIGTWLARRHTQIGHLPIARIRCPRDERRIVHERKPDDPIGDRSAAREEVIARHAFYDRTRPIAR